MKTKAQTGRSVEVFATEGNSMSRESSPTPLEDVPWTRQLSSNFSRMADRTNPPTLVESSEACVACHAFAAAGMIWSMASSPCRKIAIHANVSATQEFRHDRCPS